MIGLRCLFDIFGSHQHEKKDKVFQAIHLDEITKGVTMDRKEFRLTWVTPTFRDFRDGDEAEKKIRMECLDRYEKIRESEVSTEPVREALEEVSYHLFQTLL